MMLTVVRRWFRALIWGEERVAESPVAPAWHVRTWTASTANASVFVYPRRAFYDIAYSIEIERGGF